VRARVVSLLSTTSELIANAQPDLTRRLQLSKVCSNRLPEVGIQDRKRGLRVWVVVGQCLRVEEVEDVGQQNFGDPPDDP
jgi:hypothetical protein